MTFQTLTRAAARYELGVDERTFEGMVRRGWIRITHDAYGRPIVIVESVFTVLSMDHVERIR
jgi:hypothetical protein